MQVNNPPSNKHDRSAQNKGYLGTFLVFLPKFNNAVQLMTFQNIKRTMESYNTADSFREKKELNKTGELEVGRRRSS